MMTKSSRIQHLPEMIVAMHGDFHRFHLPLGNRAPAVAAIFPLNR
jgi:hypothetical protein